MSHIIKAIINYLRPPKEWQVVATVLIGIFCGLVLLIFRISNASSYLSDEPATCINCHVMKPHYATWRRSSHARVAKCVDCHVPHDNLIHKYQFKMQDGVRHATIFTMRAEPQVIKIHEAGAAVVQENCLRCHAHIVQDVQIHQVSYNDYLKGEGKLCWDCHREVPHGRVHSLSATPNTRAPDLPGVIPDWLENMMPNIEKK